jgi:hypothetical protein
MSLPAYSQNDENEIAKELRDLEALKAAAELRKNLPRRYDPIRQCYYIDIRELKNKQKENKDESTDELNNSS